jgi:ATP-dependent Clp protease ATP-binding subunit ClpX
MDKIIEKRQIKKPALGLAASATKDVKVEKTAIEALGGIEPEDLAKFGLIPEFVGRLPVNAMLEELDEDALVQILTKPKNAITKQYKQLFNFDGIELDFDEDALVEVAKVAIKKKTGARGLRSILEQTMLDVMYEIPSNEKIAKCVVTKLAIQGKEQPKLIEGEKKSPTEPTKDGPTKVESAS